MRKSFHNINTLSSSTLLQVNNDVIYIGTEGICADNNWHTGDMERNIQHNLLIKSLMSTASKSGPKWTGGPKGTLETHQTWL